MPSPNLGLVTEEERARATSLIEATWGGTDYLAAAKDGDPDDSKDTSDKTPSYVEDPDAPKLTPGIKPSSPKDSQPKDDKSDDSDSPAPDAPKPKETEDDGDDPDNYDEVDVQATARVSAYPYGSKCPECDAATMRTERRTGPDAMETCANGHQYRRGKAVKLMAQTEAVKKPIRDKAINERIRRASKPPLPNPDKGGPGSAPNPDNGGGSPNSYDQGKKTPLSKMPWFMGATDPRYAEMKAKWPLTFDKIEKDFHRPNKPSNPGQEPKAQDSQKPATEEQPYQTTTK